MSLVDEIVLRPEVGASVGLRRFMCSHAPPLCRLGIILAIGNEQKGILVLERRWFRRKLRKRLRALAHHADVPRIGK
jgi:hypothetical protein